MVLDNVAVDSICAFNRGFCIVADCDNCDLCVSQGELQELEENGFQGEYYEQ